MLVKQLALQPHHQLHHKLVIELLWPELNPEAAADNLHKNRSSRPPRAVAGIGWLLARTLFLTQDQQVMLRSPGEIWIDLGTF